MTLSRLLSILLLPSSFIALGQQQPGFKPKIRVGAVIPLTGELALSGNDFLQGMELSLADLKIANPELGARISLVSKDYGSNGTRGAEIVKAMFANHEADMLIGPITNSLTKNFYTTIESTQKPFISATDAGIGLTNLGENVFRTCVSDAYQGRALAAFASMTLNKQRAAIVLDESSEYARTLAGGFEKQMLANGGKILGRIGYVTPADFPTVLAQLEKLRPEVLLLPAPYNEATQLMADAKAKGLRTIFLGSDLWDTPKLYQKAPNREALKGHYFVTHFSPLDPDPMVKDFVTRFTQKNMHPPSSYAAMGYDAISFVAESFSRAKSTVPSNLTRAFAAAKDVRSLTGGLTINRDREVEKPIAVLATSPDSPRWKSRLAVSFSAEQPKPQVIQ